MKLETIHNILCLMILYAFGMYDCKCKEYALVFQEFSCHKIYLLKPTKIPEIHWNELTYPCNSTDLQHELDEYAGCILEFECMGNQFDCTDKIVPTNHATHSLIPSNDTMQHPKNKKEELDVPKTNIVVSEKPNHIVNEEVDESMYDVNVIYLNENKIGSSSELNKKLKNQNETIQCLYAKISCSDRGNNGTRHNEAARTLVITFDRDEGSPLQPIFTGLYPQLLGNLNSTHSNFTELIDSSFKHFRAVTLKCELLEEDDCIQNIDNKSRTEVNVYLKVNYIQNGTRTKYSNCTKDYSTHNMIINCDATNFSKYNSDIVYAPISINTSMNNVTAIKYNNESKQENDLVEPELLIWNCRIELNNSLHTEQDYNIIYFKNCSNNIALSNNKKNRKLNDLIGDKIDQINLHTTENSFDAVNKYDNTKTSTIKTDNRKINDSISSITKENALIIHIIENRTNCPRNTSLSIHEGKIISLVPNDVKEKIMENLTVELKLSNCIKNKSSIMNETSANQQTVLNIILKTSSLNVSNSNLTNGILKNDHLKQIIILQCDHANNSLNMSTKTNEIVLECKSIELDYFKNSDGLDDKIGLKPNASNTKEQKKSKVNTLTENNNSSSNKTTDPNECKNNSTRKEIRTKVDNNNEMHKNTNSKEKDQSENLTFNRRKDLAEALGQETLALELEDTERILLIVLSSVAGACIVLVLSLKICCKKDVYGPAPTREAADEEETAF